MMYLYLQGRKDMLAYQSWQVPKQNLTEEQPFPPGDECDPFAD